MQKAIPKLYENNFFSIYPNTITDILLRSFE